MSRKITVATLVASALLASTSAFAADQNYRPVPAPAPYPTNVVDYAFTWTGAYVGVNAGYRWADTKARSTYDTNVNLNDGSPFGGLQAGYNWQAGNFVYGLETDFGYGSNSKSRTTADAYYSVKQTWEGTTRARLGFAYDKALFYGTGGLAYADFKSTFDDGVTTAKKDGFRLGWTVGGGIEYAMTKNVSLKGEYLYTDYGTQKVGGSKQDISNNLLRVGLNYRF